MEFLGSTLLINVLLVILILQQLRLASFANDWTNDIRQLSIIRNQLQDMRVATKMESGMGFEEALRIFPEKEFFGDDEYQDKFQKMANDKHQDEFQKLANDIDRRYHLAWKRRHQESQKSLTSRAWWGEL